MKNKKAIIFLIVLLSVITIFLTTIFIISLTSNKLPKFFNFKFSSKVSNELVFDETYENIFDEIKIESKASDIELKVNDSDFIKVVIYGDKDKTKVETKENKLTIQSDSKSCYGICINMTIAKIEIYLPSTYSNKIDIDNNYGDIKIENFKEMIASINEDYGDIEIDALKEAKITNNYGDIKINKIDNLDAKESSGDVIIKNVNTIKVKNNYGDIKITNVEKSMDIEDDCGDIDVDSISLVENSKVINNYGDINIGKTNEIYINAKTSLGDTKINNNYKNSDINLIIKNDCGDIKVNN